MREQNHHVYAFGPFHLDATRRVLLKEGELVKVFPKEFDTLLALVERSGELLEKDELMRQVWPDAIVEESNLTTNISHLRARKQATWSCCKPNRNSRSIQKERGS